MSSSWLPFGFNFSFPTLTPPLSIQRRFISFLLKRCLGHLLKPGQLDIDQIDAQIGNGFVEVKDLELDCNAINSLLDGQPVQLQSGTIAAVTARIPWPNPFSSTIGLSLSGLRLEFYISKPIHTSRDINHADELAESVAAVAETFIHQELTEKEEAQLRQSAHLNQGAFDDIPGSLEPFLGQDQEPPHRPVNDPEGVSIFAGLFESLLARFDFDASDSQISLIHDRMTITLIVSRIRYFTEASSPGQSSDLRRDGVGETRSVQIQGVKLTMQDQLSSSSPPSSPADTPGMSPTPSSAAHENSDSELDDETQMMMSQSLVSLPPRPSKRSMRPPSPSLSAISSTSVASTMYESAISASEPSSPPHVPLVGADSHLHKCITERTILAISEPITLQLTTPPVAARESSNVHNDSPSRSSKGRGKGMLENMKLDISIGVIAILVDARSVHGLLTFASAFASVSRQPYRPREISPSPDTSEPTILDRIDLSLNLKGLVALVLGDSVDGLQEESSASQFYERPLVPPYLVGGYVRLHVETIKAALKAEASMDYHVTSFHRSSASPPPLSQTSTSRKSLVSCTISDISILAFHSSTSPPADAGANSNSNSSSPLLITDRNLSNSYQSSSIRSGVNAYRHIHPYSDEDKRTPLPVLDASNWTSKQVREHGTSLRPWRTKVATLPHHRKTSSGLGAGFVPGIGIATLPTRTMRNPLAVDVPSLKPKETPAVSAKLHLGNNVNNTSITVETAPLHLFINLEDARSVSAFMETAFADTGVDMSTKLPSPASDWSHSTDEDDEDQPLSPKTIGEERRRLEKLVLDDLDLDLDYRQSGDLTPRRRASPSRMKPKGRQVKPQSAPQFDVSLPLLRLEVRVPPPRSRQPRSGSLVLDFHSAHFSSSAQHLRNESRVPRFKTSSEDNAGLEEWLGDLSAAQPVCLEIRQAIIAYAGLSQSKAETFLSLGPVSGPESEDARDENNLSPLIPLVLFRTCESPGAMAPQSKPTALLARIPSLHVVVNKVCLDGLQLWADDVSQWAERLTTGHVSGNSTRSQVSRTTSLIGSRYFIQRSGSGSTESEMTFTTNSGTAKSELVVKACLSEVFIRLVIPVGDGVGLDSNRFLDICASDLDALVEVKPGGKDETVVSLNVLDANIKESSSAGLHNVMASRPLSINRNRSAALKLRFRSVSLPGTVAKESKVKIVLNGLTINMWSDVAWISDLSSFVKTPPGAFESVIPSERTHISISILECAFRVTPPSRQSAIVLSLGDVTVSTDLVGESQETALNTSVSDLSVLLNDDSRTSADNTSLGPETDVEHWMGEGYALLATVQGLTLHLKHSAKTTKANVQVAISGMLLNVHLCADSISGISGFVADLESIIPVNTDVASTAQVRLPRRPTDVSGSRSSTLLHSLDEQAFRRQPVIGPLPDMINDDLPENPEYLDASFGAAAGFRALDEEEDDDEFFPEGASAVLQPTENIIAKHGGETIKMLCSPIEITEHFYDTLTPSSLDLASEHGDTSFRVRAQDCDIHLLLYDGYDWERTRRTIQEEVKRVRRRLARIRQLLASGQSYDPNVDEVNSVLFNSIFVGLEQDAEDMEGEALMAAIDDELGGDDTEVASESSWQSFKPNRRAKSEVRNTTLRFNRLNRARGPSMEFSLCGMAVDFDQYLPGASLASRLLFTIKDLKILDHIKTSTWSTFLTELRSDSRGNIRETDSNMARIELQMLQPFQGHLEQEARLKAKLLPLRLHVDQDALDFLKKFFSFEDANATPSPPPENEIFFQHVEIFPIDIKLDYKPRRVDYRALKEGKTIELMNFFHFDGSEMTLRHITLKGITGWPRMFDTLNDLWTPDVKANQLVDVISGVSPIRSAVNVGSGVADLVLLPIAQYKKDGRIIRGLQKGTTAFVKSTAMEAIRIGARLATGTQVVLEHTENVLGAQFPGPMTAETVQTPGSGDLSDRHLDDESTSAEDLFSRYAEQPSNVSEGVNSAYRTLSQNIKYAGQTILAVPMEVYERSGKEGPARAVIRAVPIAVLKPMIGASEAISKTLLGLHNTLDPQAQIDTEAKYKHR